MILVWVLLFLILRKSLGLNKYWIECCIDIYFRFFAIWKTWFHYEKKKNQIQFRLSILPLLLLGKIKSKRKAGWLSQSIPIWLLFFQVLTFSTVSYLTNNFHFFTLLFHISGGISMGQSVVNKIYFWYFLQILSFN